MAERESLASVCVIIPTYNEADNVRPIVARVRTAEPDVHVLIADDNSPDGTGELADELAAHDNHVHVLHRAGKQGLGAAYLAGFDWALERGYDVLVECDADGSHQPEQLGLLLDALTSADMVKGSRWIPGGTVVNWPKNRELLSKGANLWTKLWLGLPVNDATGGFNAFRAETLRGIHLDDVASAGYCFQVDLARRAHRAGYRLIEVPIEFVERTAGDSKMSKDIIAEALWRTTMWGVRYRAGQLAGLVRRTTGRRSTQ